MNAVTFDTHAFIKRLTAVGMPEAQAEVLADEQVRLIDERLGTLATREDIAKLGAATKEDIAKLGAATKTDIERLEVATKAEIARLESFTKTAVAESKVETIKWVSGMISFQTIVILGAVFAMVHLFIH